MTPPEPDLRRSNFESWISAKPYEREVKRFPTRIGKFPGQYQDFAVEMAWSCWCSSKTSQELSKNLTHIFTTEGIFKPKMMDHEKVTALLAGPEPKPDAH